MQETGDTMPPGGGGTHGLIHCMSTGYDNLTVAGFDGRTLAP